MPHIRAGLPAVGWVGAGRDVGASSHWGTRDPLSAPGVE